MGRRALRKLPEGLDYSAHLLRPETMQTPFQASDYFSDFPQDGSADLEIEVGSGKGLFLANVASAVPERFFLGIEIAKKYAEFIAAKLARKGLQNARIMHGDAERFFAEQLPDNLLAAVHVYFPDPWWKKRHHKRRIMNERFLKDVARVLRPGGSLHFWTDVQDYFEQAVELIATKIPLSPPHSVDEATAEHDLDYRTHFERRTRLHGEAVYRARFEKP
ncbi:MAG: tRNA (guanosine(46)-N7)-methyltransferase TrmB [Planctomycetales bacterium]|nr:tRNA (guanosine(46)-N7)-methyltransferase TrmB [Planctomycetales bacterium]